MSTTKSTDGWWTPLTSRPWTIFLLTFLFLLLCQRPLIGCFVVSYLVYLAFGGWKFQYLLFATMPRDIRGLRCLINMMRDTGRIVRKKETFPEMFARVVELRGANAVAILYEDQQWTFRQLDAYSNKVANHLLQHGFKRGDCLFLLLESSPAFVAIWLGAAKIGVATALVNYNLRKASLNNSLQAVEGRGIVVGMKLQEAFRECEMASKFDENLIWFVDEQSTTPVCGFSEFSDSRGTWNQLLAKASYKAPPALKRIENLREPLLYIYTSGTTGMPKAAVITRFRFMYMTCGLRYGFRIRKEDVLYTALPLYHTNAGICGVGQLLLYGTTLAIRSHFSASQFWTDCIKYKATVVQYIGELCRYLLAQPERPTDRQHSVRLALGNGLRKVIWIKFQERFNIPQIGEYFGATESNTSIPNITGKVGAVGFVPFLFKKLYPIDVIKTDLVTGQIIRDPKTGFCIRCEPFEYGQIIGRIVNTNPMRIFDGYVKKEDSEKKVLRDVFKKNDAWFLSGDLMYLDEFTYLYFADRLGDTFRWRGENVSTSEVESVVNTVVTNQCNIVYGVQVPGIEGRAGMLALAVDWDKLTAEEESKLIDNLTKAFNAQLPSYARPVFIRLRRDLDMTDTFKMRKVNLVKEGFSLSKPDDHVYYCDPKLKTYKRLDQAALDQIEQGVIRL